MYVDSRDLPTRSRDAVYLKVLFWTSAIAKRAPIYYGSIQFNLLYKDIRNIDTLEKFRYNQKAALKGLRS